MKTLRTIFLLGIFTLLAFADSTEIKRPSADSDPGSSTWATNNCGIGTYTTNSTAGTNGRDAAGQSTSVVYSQPGTSTTTKVTSRTWTTWTSTLNSYSALTLNVNSASGGIGSTVGGTACVVYSLNSGSTWTAIRCDSASGWTQTTDTVTLSAAQSLSMLRVGICVAGNSGGSSTDGTLGRDNVTVYDIWTSGTTSAQAAGTGSGSGTAVQPVQFN